MFEYRPLASGTQGATHRPQTSGGVTPWTIPTKTSSTSINRNYASSACKNSCGRRIYINFCRSAGSRQPPFSPHRVGWLVFGVCLVAFLTRALCPNSTFNHGRFRLFLVGRPCPGPGRCDTEHVLGRFCALSFCGWRNTNVHLFCAQDFESAPVAQPVHFEAAAVDPASTFTDANSFTDSFGQAAEFNSFDAAPTEARAPSPQGYAAVSAFTTEPESIRFGVLAALGKQTQPLTKVHRCAASGRRSTPPSSPRRTPRRRSTPRSSRPRVPSSSRFVWVCGCAGVRVLLFACLYFFVCFIPFFCVCVFVFVSWFCAPPTH
jgi:hypothetical protein